MILLSSEVASSLFHWEIAEYIAEGFVILGCAGELVALIRRIPRRCREQIETCSTVVLVLALMVGLKCLIKTNALSEMEIGSLGEAAEQADKKARQAIADSNTALSQSKDALTKSGEAKNAADHAEQASGKASGTASRADKEAGRANQKVIAVGKDAEELRQKTRALSQELSAAEKAALPGRLQQQPFAAQLKPLNGFLVLIETIPDFEARRSAEIIRGALRMADWLVPPVVVRLDEKSVQDFFFPGVMVEDTCGPNPALDNELRSAPRSSEDFARIREYMEQQRKSVALWKACTTAAGRLVTELNANGIEAHGPRPDNNMPLNTIRVRVALKPMPGNPPENLIITH
jgi:hypothetical protein